MKSIKTQTRSLAFFFLSLVLCASCSSSTLIHSIPSGAKLYLDGEPVGRTPYRHTDTRITGATMGVKLEMEGYETLHSSFSRNEEVDVGAVVGGVFFFWPFLWTMKYKPTHSFELSPLAPNQNLMNPQSSTDCEKEKTEAIEKIRALLNELDK